MMDEETRLTAHASASSLTRLWAVLLLPGLLLSGCSRERVHAGKDSLPAATVGITRVVRRPIARRLKLSSELIPNQEIDLYAKEAGYVKAIYVDYGSRVKAGPVACGIGNSGTC